MYKFFIPPLWEEVIFELENEVEKKHFSAWSASDGKIAVSCAYVDELPIKPPSASQCGEHPYFDLSSLTKPLLVHPLLHQLFDVFWPQKVALPLIDIWQPYRKIGKTIVAALKKQAPELRLLDLLNHTSGAKPWLWFGTSTLCQQFNNTEEQYEKILLELIDKIFLSWNRVDNTCVYSDLNYFILARIFEDMGCGEQSVQRFWNRALEAMNAKLNSHFFHVSLTPQLTSLSMPFSSHKDPGFVHDTNASILASLPTEYSIVSCHAGLFGNIEDVCKGMANILNPAFLKALETLDQPLGRFAFGLDTPSGAGSLAGLKEWPVDEKYKIFGHLGYTGTSFWGALRSDGLQSQSILLTNRTACTRRPEDVDKHKVPRILIITDFDLKTTTYYSVFPSNILSSASCVSKDDVTYLQKSYQSKQQRLSVGFELTALPDISNIRKFIGNKFLKYG